MDTGFSAAKEVPTDFLARERPSEAHAPVVLEGFEDRGLLEGLDSCALCQYGRNAGPYMDEGALLANCKAPCNRPRRPQGLPQQSAR